MAKTPTKSQSQIFFLSKCLLVHFLLILSMHKKIEMRNGKGAQKCKKKNCLNKCALFKKLEFFNNEIDTGMICIVKVFLEKFK